MLVWMRRLFHRHSTRFASMLLSNRTERTRVRNPQFLSHLSAHGFNIKRRCKEEKAVRRRQAIVSAAAWGVAVLLVWFVVESARALALF
jgi:hypothetical protein